MFAARLSRTAIGQARNSRIPPQRSKLLFPGPRLPQTPLQTHRYHRYQRFGQGDSSSYSSSRFGWLSRWAASPYFYHQIGGGGLVLALGYTANLESVPVTGRRRFNVISKERERQLGKSAYEGIMRAHRHEILPEWDPRTRTVRRVLDRLVPAAGLGDFEAYVIDDPDEKNAFVIPGNKVFVFTGILPICHDEAGLASVLGHEIAHNVARHSAERLSQSLILVGVWLAVSLAFGTPDSALNLIWTYAFERPGSRKQEAEADYIGLLMMAQSCYNPAAAVEMWRRMAEAEEEEGESVPQLLSTHPTPQNRQQTMLEWLPQAMDKYNATDCHSTSAFADQFRKSWL